jgi:S-adenosyl-L-methionine hydrolase (adenosine-forming)
MIVLLTDYCWADPYVGQVKCVLHREAPGIPIVDLCHDLPDFNAHAGAHLLDAFAFPAETVVLAVVDPGVGGPREAVAVRADGVWFVGPDNGLLSVRAQRAQRTEIYRILWRPEHLSDTFHGRDLFAPIAARLARGDAVASDGLEPVLDLQVVFDPSDLPRVIYIDHYGNAWTGLRGASSAEGMTVKGRTLSWRRTFAEADKGEVFWHVNANGLVEIAANRASAAEFLGLKVGDRVDLAMMPTRMRH